MSLLILAILFAVTCPAHATWTEDASNNFASDLAPFLALFGEKMLLHWLSQCVTGFEVFVIAVCPIGVPALIISAIRLAGGQTMRNIIGRPRESRPVVESELTPSTSDEVSESWDGQRVVRTIGEGKTQEYFVLRRVGVSSTDRIVVKKLSECVGTYIVVGDVPNFPGKPYEILKSTFISLTRRLASINLPSLGLSFAISLYTGRSRSASDVEHNTVSLNELPPRAPSSPHTPRDDAGDDAGVILIKNDKNKSPNLSLNIQEHFYPKFGTLKVFLALCGFFLGFICPLMLFRLRPDWGVKDDQEVPVWSKAIFKIGSFGMLIGSLILGSIICRTTAMVVYRPAPGWQLDRPVWLQSKSTINYQHFFPHIIFPNKPKDYIITTERRELSLWLTRCCDVTSTVCVVAFIMQLVGLRAMHPILQFVHMGALLWMTGVRYFVNAHLANQPSARPLISGFEMDWLSMAMAKGLQDAPWSQALEANSHEESDGSDRPWAANGGWDWKAPSWEDLQKCVPLVHDAPLDSKARPSKAQEALNLRKGIAKAGATLPPSTELAVCVAQAIEGTLKTLADSGEGYLEPGCRSLLWKIGGHPDDVVEVRLDLDVDNEWKVQASDLEAILSLWLFKTSCGEKARERQPAAEAVPVGESISIGSLARHASVGQEDEWLRKHSQKSPALSPMPPQGNPLPALFQGINLWLHEPFRDICQFGLVALQHNIPSSEPSHRRSSTSPPQSSYKRPFELSSSNLPGQHFTTLGEVKTLVEESEGSLEIRHAQHLFCLFMWSLAKTLKKPIGGLTQAVGRRDSKVSFLTQFALRNSHLEKISTKIFFAELGYEETALPAILLPLLVADKLPSSHEIFEAVRRHHYDFEQYEPWDRKNSVDLWLFRNLIELPLKKEFFIKVASFFIDSLEHMCLDHAPRDDISRFMIMSTLNDVIKITRSYIGDSGWKMIKRAVSLSESHDARFSRAFSSTSAQLGLEPISDHSGNTSNPVPPHNLTPLQLFCLNGEDLSEEKITEVIRDNADDINTVDIFGRTAIHYAIQRDNSRKFELVKKLVDSGAKVNIPDLFGRTPWHLAAHCPELSVVKTLFEHQLREEALNIRDSKGLTPLHHAAAWGKHDVLEILVQYKKRLFPAFRFDGGAAELVHCYARYREAHDLTPMIDLGMMNLPDNHGRTGFHLAVINAKIKAEDIPEIFRDIADFNHQDSFSETPLSLAERIQEGECGHACSPACVYRMKELFQALRAQHLNLSTLPSLPALQ